MKLEKILTTIVLAGALAIGIGCQEKKSEQWQPTFFEGPITNKIYFFRKDGNYNLAVTLYDTLSKRSLIFYNLDTSESKNIDPLILFGESSRTSDQYWQSIGGKALKDLISSQNVDSTYSFVPINLRNKNHPCVDDFIEQSVKFYIPKRVR